MLICCDTYQVSMRFFLGKKNFFDVIASNLEHRYERFSSEDHRFWALSLTDPNNINFQAKCCTMIAMLKFNFRGFFYGNNCNSTQNTSAVCFPKQLNSCFQEYGNVGNFKDILVSLVFFLKVNSRGKSKIKTSHTHFEGDFLDRIKCLHRK